jgi:Leucine-rich repeat (LRR) protein
MKMIFFSLMLLILTSVEVNAQSCKKSCPYYADFVKRAQADTVKNAQTKLNYYRAAIVAAKDCHCPELEQSAYKQIDTLFILIEEEKRMAEAQAQTILEQQSELETTLTKTKAANEKSIKIINAMDFYDGKFALALKNGKYGFIDKDGNTKIEFEYDKGAPFDSETGFAEMEIIDKSTNKGVKYLVDTIGNRYQLINITEEYLLLLKNKLAKNKKETELEGREFNLKSVNEVLAYNLNKSEEKIALNFHRVNDISRILKYLAKDNKIKDRVEVLICDEDDMSTFPSAIVEFKNFKYIDIYWTSIRSIPRKIDRLKGLKRIKFSNWLKRIPSSIYNLENLEVLNLYGTHLTVLSADIGKLKNLKRLDIPEDLKKIPSSIYGLENLEILTLSGTDKKGIPEAIKNLKNLKELSINIQLEEIPSEIWSLENLRYLNLLNLKMKKIPNGIGNLKKLEELVLPYSLEKLPEDIICSLKNLKKLDAEYTLLKSLPENISNLKKLEELVIPELLEKLPEDIGNLINLKKLSQLEGTEIKILPESIGQLINLEYLSLPNSLKIVPKSIDKLVNLKELWLPMYIDVENIPDISKMKKLELCVYTVKRNKNYAANLAKIRALAKKTPNCKFVIF